METPSSIEEALPLYSSIDSCNINGRNDPCMARSFLRGKNRPTRKNIINARVSIKKKHFTVKHPGVEGVIYFSDESFFFIQ